MRIAALADIHGNALALEAVATDLKRHAPDLIVNLGDCLSGPMEPARTADILMAQGWATVKGNHDRWLHERPVSKMGKTDAFASGELTPKHLLWLMDLPFSLSLAGGEVTAFHATPHDDNRYLTEEVFERGDMLRPLARVGKDLDGITSGLILCGHSHIPRVLSLADGRTILNPGSVGCPAYEDTEPFPHVMETGSPHARYAIADHIAGRWHVQLLSVAYDWEAASRQCLEAGRRDWAQAVATGYAMVGA